MSKLVLATPSQEVPEGPLRKRSFSQPEHIGQCLQRRSSKNPISTPFVLVNSLGTTPDERYGHSAVVDCETDTDVMYIFGGSNSNQNHFSSELFAFRFRDNKWIQIHPEAQEAIQNDSEDSKMLWPQGRHFHSAVTYRRQMIICGGKSNGYMNDLHAFDYKTKEWREIVPNGDERISRRYGHMAVVYNDSMYIMGGYDDFGLKCNDLWEFSFNKNEWSKIPTLGTPPERYHHSAVVFEGSLYVFGGFQGYDDLYEYRFGSRTWSVVNTKGAPPNPRWGHRAVTVKRYMFVFGGCDLVINYNDVHRYHFDTGRWEKLPGGGYTQGYFQTAVVYNDRIYIFGGKNIHNYNFNDLYEYRLDVEVKANPNTFEEDFRNMLFDNDFTDIIFSFPNEGRQIKAHRHILFARCPKFREYIPSSGGRFANMIKSDTTTDTSSNTPSKTRSKRSRSRNSPAPKQEKASSTRRRKRKSKSRKRLTEKTIQIDNTEEFTNTDKINVSVQTIDDMNMSSIETEDKEQENIPTVTIETKNEKSEEDDVWEGMELHTVVIQDIKYDIFRRFLEYIYSGYFDMAQPYAFELLPLAFAYNLDHLKTMCGVKIQLSINTENVLEALQLADNCKAMDLKSFCLSFIAEHREAVTPRKGELHPDLLKEVKKWLTVQSLEKLQSNTTPIYQSILT